MTENNSKKKTFAERAASQPTELHERFAKWIKEQTGFEADVKTVQLAVAFRMDFQASPENQEALTAKKQTAAQKEAARVAKRKAALEAELAKLSSATVVTEEPKAEEQPAADESEVKTEEAPEAAEATEAAPVEVKAEVTETATEEPKVEEAPKPRARRSRRTNGQQPVV